jgi:BirA family biotin operon repressor/biotin-[acetyl-CoA-carboxylase] ligase
MLPYQVALAIRETLVKLGAANDAVKCKWPNDILINEKKASGVLIEASSGIGDKPDYVVIGIGINLVHFPENAQFPATSLMRETGIAADINTVFQILSSELNGLLNVGDNEAIIQAWENESWGLGQIRQVNLIDERFEARLLSLGPDGGLLVRKLPEGQELTIYAGDIFENYPDDERQS